MNKIGGNFQQLLSNLNSMIISGRTTDVLPFAQYIIGDSNYPAGGRVFPLED